MAKNFRRVHAAMKQQYNLANSINPWYNLIVLLKEKEGGEATYASYGYLKDSKLYIKFGHSLIKTLKELEKEDKLGQIIAFPIKDEFDFTAVNNYSVEKADYHQVMPSQSIREEYNLKEFFLFHYLNEKGFHCMIFSKYGLDWMERDYREEINNDIIKEFDDCIEEIIDKRFEEDFKDIHFLNDHDKLFQKDKATIGKKQGTIAIIA